MQNWTTKKVLLKTQSKKPNNFLYYQIYFDSFYFTIQKNNQKLINFFLIIIYRKIIKK